MRLLRLPFQSYRKSLVWILTAIISMIPFLGLGGLTERYALVPSALMMMALATGLETLWQTRVKKRIAQTVVIIIISLMVWNYVELMRVSGDWKKASSVSETAILAMKANFFPLQNTQAFVFVNTPIRYGRAWIFPTGLTDALWHMFKFNTFAYSIYKVPTIKEAFTLTSPQGIPYILQFDHFVLKRVTREVKTVEVEEGQP